MAGPQNIPLTILIVSHDKPRLLPEAVLSVLGQSFRAWQGILVDSGVLHDQGFFKHAPWGEDPRLRIIRSRETPALRRRKAMAPWCFNECFRRGWATGELVMYLCDDDILYPNAVAIFVEAFQKNPAAMAMYASQDIGWIGTDGTRAIIGERRALAPGGRCCNGRIMDCQVDYGQLCHRRAALAAFPNDEYWPEDPRSESHADGLFMDRLGDSWPILPLDIKVGQNRRTPWSLNLPTVGTCHGSNERQPEKLVLPSPPVHETIMDTWAALRACLERDPMDSAIKENAATFQRQLRLLCEQDHAQRRRLLSRRYRLADKLHALFAKVTGSRTGFGDGQIRCSNQ